MVFKIRNRTPAAPESSAPPAAEVIAAGEFIREQPEPAEAAPAPYEPPRREYQAYQGWSNTPTAPGAPEPTELSPYSTPPVSYTQPEPYAPSAREHEQSTGYEEPSAYRDTAGAYTGFSETIDMPPQAADAGSSGASAGEPAPEPPQAGNGIHASVDDLYEAEAVEVVEPAKRKGLFGLKRNAPKQAKLPKHKKAPKPVRTRSRAGARGSAAESLVLQIAMRDLHGTFLKVTAEGVAPVEGAVAHSVRVSEADHHLALPGKRSRKAAMDHAVATISGQATILFPADKEDPTFFAAPLEEIRQADHACSPVQGLVTELLRKRFPGKEGCVAALALVDRDAGATTLLLFHRADTGLIREPYVVMRSDDLEMDLNSFYENRQVPLADRDRVAIFSNQEVLAAAAGLPTYPRDRTFAGVGATALLTLISAAGVAVTVLSAAYAGTVYVSWQQADNALRSEKSKNARLSTELAKLIEGSVQSYAKLANLEVAPTLELLEKLHSPGSIGAVKLDRNNGAVLEYTLSLNRSGSSNTTTSNSLTSPETIAAFRSKPAPEGCNKTALALTEGGNVLKASFVCKMDSGNFGRHRLD